MRSKDTSLAVIPDRVSEAVFDATSAHLATIFSITEDGSLEVQVDATGPKLTARLAVAVTRARIETAIVLQQQAVVLFENGDRSKPIIVGLIETLQPEPAMPQAGRAEASPIIEADVDGKRVRLTAHDEIVLECGPASVTLRRNGRVIIRGTYVETRSEGTNRIKGGQVQIN
jgi:uncharacterized protein DUF6484